MSARRFGIVPRIISRIVPRIVLRAAVLAALASCGAPPAPVHTAPALCVPEHLDVCEQRLAASVAAPSRELAAAYAAARVARDAGDPWAALYAELDAKARGARPRAVIVVTGGPAPAAAKGARVVTVGDLPPPAAIPAEDLLLSLARATGYDHLVLVHGADVTQLFPGDPLAPFMGGLRPVLREVNARGAIEGDLAAEDLLRAALQAAGSFHYVEAARAAASLSALVEGRAGSLGPRLRHRHALQLLAAAGLVLDADESAAPAARAAEPPASPAAYDTPYGSYLRVVTARDPRKEWEARGPRVLEGIAEDRREAFASLFSRPRGCEERRVPKLSAARDLVFTSQLAGAAGQLPLREWLSLYQAAVGLVEGTHTAWSFLPSLLAQRGASPGLGAAGTPGYARVTELGLAHLAAIRELDLAYPVRSRASAQMSLAVSPGLLGDDALREALVQLTEASVQGKLAAAKDAAALLLGIVTGAAAGLSYPPALQEAHFRALARAAEARLEGDFLQKTGWGVAALYALDGIHRLAARSGQSLAFSSRQIARALGAPDVAPPALASLATAAARYVALAGDRRLDPSVLALDKPTPERRAARDGLRAALAGLGAPGEAPNDVLDDVTALTDGLVASLGAALAAGAAKKAPPRAGTCAPRAPAAPLDPELRRTLAKLGDVRRRILLHPRYKEGDGLWVRRVRLLVTVLSDAMDLVLAGDVQKAPVFAVPAGDAQRVITEALRELDQKAVTEVALGGHGLLRALTSAGRADALLKKATPDLERVAAGLFALFRGDGLGGQGPAMGVTFLDALAAIHFEAPRSPDLVATLAAYAAAFYEKKQADQADFCLLAGLLVASLTHAEIPPAVVDLAARNESRLAWVLRFSQEARRRKAGEAPDPSVYAEGMRRATDDACQAPDAEATLAVMGAIRDRAAGKNEEAVLALDRVLAQADEKGLGVPRMNLRYEEKTATKVFSVSVDVSYGSGILLAGKTYQLGLGLRSAGEPQGALTTTLLPEGTAQAGEDAARYYVYTAALATVYHLLDGDTDGAVASGRRVVGALEGGVKLGARALRAEKQASWGEDAREVLIVAAQLAAEAGLPFLAGDSVDGGAGGALGDVRRCVGEGGARCVAAGAGWDCGAGAGGGAGGAVAQDPGGAAALHRRQGGGGRVRGGGVRGLSAGPVAARRGRAEEAAALAARRCRRGALRGAAEPRCVPRGGGQGRLRSGCVHARRGGSAGGRAGLRRGGPAVAVPAVRATAMPRWWGRRGRWGARRCWGRGSGRICWARRWTARRRRGGPRWRRMCWASTRTRGGCRIRRATCGWCSRWRTWPRGPIAGGCWGGWSSSRRSSRGGWMCTRARRRRRCCSTMRWR